MPLLIRDSRPDDIPAITAIFGHAVLHGNASFELAPPDELEVARRRDALVRAGFPHLVAEDSAGRVVGYCSAGTYRPRPGYRFTVENSIYVAPDCQGQGIGRAMLPRLIDRCEQAGFRLMVAVIGDSANHASIRLHAGCGFRHAGLLPAIGWKHERWLDSVLMVRPLGAGASVPPPPDR
jgi:L-amino acid N-acyltransferase YncA